MKRTCPHCGQEMPVFDEACDACGKPSKPGVLQSVAAVVYGYRSWIVLVAVLIVSWFVLTKLTGM